jgi:hypothetical protein
MNHRAPFAIATFALGAAFAASCGGEEQPDQGAAVTEEAVVAATLTLAPAGGSSAAFGNVLLGAGSTQIFVVTNVGTGQRSSRITISTSGTAFAILAPVGSDCVSGSSRLAPNSTCTVRVRFTPTVAGATAATLTARAQTGGTATLALTGTGTILSNGPCDILATAGNACAAAHSTVRALYRSYTGPLYQVCRGAFIAGPNSCSSGMTLDIGVVAGVYANAAAQDTFCAGMTCTISTIYDQSPNKNDLKPAPSGAVPTADNPANATDLKTTINGHAAYGVFIKPGMGYRAGCNGCGVVVAKGTATGDEAETEYMVTSQNGLINGCCFDYGNAETSSNDDGNGTEEAVYFGGGVVWGTGAPGGHNNGPWVMADLENGLYAGWENGQDQNISTNTPLRLPFVTGVLVGDVAAQNAGMGRFALYGGDATVGTLKTMYDGIRPGKPGYVPMKKQGSIVLGIAGDNSKFGAGQFFEGVMATGAATLATVNALQANIVAAGYGK